MPMQRNSGVWEPSISGWGLIDDNTEEPIDPIALVSDEKWIKLCGSIENMFSSSKIKNFDVEDRLKAINWIAQRDR